MSTCRDYQQRSEKAFAIILTKFTFVKNKAKESKPKFLHNLPNALLISKRRKYFK